MQEVVQVSPENPKNPEPDTRLNTSRNLILRSEKSTFDRYIL